MNRWSGRSYRRQSSSSARPSPVATAPMRSSSVAIGGRADLYHTSGLPRTAPVPRPSGFPLRGASAGRGRGPAVDSEPCEPVLPGGERALERRGVARREGDEEPEGAVDDRPEEVHEGQNDEAEAHAHDG